MAAVMNGNRRYPFFSLTTLLHAGMLPYRLGIGIRQSLFDCGAFSIGRLNRPVISIGNLTAGGTGKTPMTMSLAKLLQSVGIKVMIVSRGYKSLSEKTGAVVSDGHSLFCDASRAGDEPYLMAKLLNRVPVMVGKNRLKTAMSGLHNFSPDLVILDDAFQHQQLYRDINLLLLDANDPFGNGYLLPRGPLREPISAVGRADAIIFTRCNKLDSDCKSKIADMIHPRPIFSSTHVPIVRHFLHAMHPPEEAILSDAPNTYGNLMRGKQVFAFAALAKNERFWSSVSSMGAEVCGSLGFPDHHYYSPSDMTAIIRDATTAGVRVLVTTDKDFVRLPKDPLPMDLIVLGVDISFGEDGGRWRRFIIEKLDQSNHTKGNSVVIGI